MLANETSGKTEGWIRSAPRDAAQLKREGDEQMRVFWWQAEDVCVWSGIVFEEDSLPKAPNGMTEVMRLVGRKR